MIPERGARVAQRHTELSPLPPVTRRAFLTLTAAAVVAGCAPAHSSASAPTTSPSASPTPPLLTPAARIELANAAHVAALGAFAAHEDGRLRSTAWSPDGTLVAAGGERDVHVWDASSGRATATWHGHTDLVCGLAWSGTSSLLASASDDGTIRLWQHDGTVVRVLGGRQDDPLSLAWSPDGKRLAAGAYSGPVQVWDITTGTSSPGWSGPPFGRGGGSYPHAAYGISWSPDGHRIISTRYDGFLLVWDATTGTLLAPLHVDSLPNSVAWSPDGRSFTSSHDNGSVRVWDATSYRTTAVLTAHNEDGWAFPMAWSPDGQIVAVARDTGLVQLYDVHHATELAALTGHLASVWSLGWAANDLRIATASDDGTVRLWGVTSQ